MLTYYQIHQLYKADTTFIAKWKHINPSLILAIVKTKSQGDIYFVGNDNSYGLMGVTEEILNDFNKATANATPNNPLYTLNLVFGHGYRNLEVGVWWLKQLLAMFSEDDAIRAYFVGVQSAKAKIDTGIKHLHQVRKHEIEFKKLIIK